MRTSLVLTITMLTVLGSGCGPGAVSIHALQMDPVAFIDQPVAIRGRMTDRITLPLLPGPVFVLDDGTGTIPVLTDALPAVTDRPVTVHGRFRNLVGFGSHTFGLYVDARRANQ